MANLAYFGPRTPLSELAAIELVEDSARTYGIVAIDTETVSLANRTCIGMGVSCRKHRIYITVESPWFMRVAQFAADSNLLKVYHNCMFDLQVLWDHCWTYNGPLPDLYNIADTSIMAQVQGLPANLSELTAILLAREIKEISDILPERKTMLDLDFEVVAGKCCDDIKATEDIFYKMDGQTWTSPEPHDWEPIVNLDFGWIMSIPSCFHVSSRIKECYRVDLSLVPILHRMGNRGIALREDKVREWYKKLSEECLRLYDMCNREGFNPGSNQQVGLVLAFRGNVLNLTDSGKQLKTDEEQLESLNDPLAHVVLAYRKASKLKGTYIDPFWDSKRDCLSSDRFYTHYRLDLATGRLASSDRNIQNIPPDLRNIFEPDNESGMWTDMDASQIELRIWAYITRDPVMLNAYKNNDNLHVITQKTLWPNTQPKEEPYYTRAKTFTYAMIFDADPPTLAKHTKLPLRTCAEFRKLWLARYPVGAEWMRQQRLNPSPWVESEFGRRMRLPDPMRQGQKHVDNCKLNYNPQGTAAGVIKRCMLLASAEHMPMAAQVHDEILADGIVDVPDIWTRIHPEIATPFDRRVSSVWY